MRRDSLQRQRRKQTNHDASVKPRDRITPDGQECPIPRRVRVLPFSGPVRDSREGPGREETTTGEEGLMARYGRDFMGRVRGMWDRLSGDAQGPMRQPPMEAMGPGGEGYFLTHDMARHASYSLDYSDHGRGDAGGRGYPAGGMAQFGRAGAGRGYG